MRFNRLCYYVIALDFMVHSKNWLITPDNLESRKLLALLELWNLESRKYFIVESGILLFGIRNPENISLWNLESYSLESGIQI